MAFGDTNIRGSEAGREKGGDTSLHTEKVSASEIAMYLKGVNFPIEKRALVDHLKTSGAPDNVMNYLDKLPEKRYTNPMEVEQEFSKVK
jgi:hypothetical protein